ncbi:MAG: hypothetical protein JXR37_22030 [Kiritimatiellae bacterium]|nr:hypothetical protein [Kiritimatiellia bacterium]
MQNPFENKPRVFAVLVLLGVGIPVGTLLLWWMTRAVHRQDVSRVVRRTSAPMRIELDASETPPSLFKDDIVVTNAEILTAFAESLRQSVSTQPNHPVTKWRCFITVTSADGESYGTIHGADGPSVLLDVTSRPRGGWILATFENDTLKRLIVEAAEADANNRVEDIAADAPNPHP